MSKKEKLENEFRTKPLKPFYDYGKVKNLLELYGFVLKRTSGSHSMFVAKGKNGKDVNILISTVNGRKVKSYQIEIILENIEKIK